MFTLKELSLYFIVFVLVFILSFAGMYYMFRYRRLAYVYINAPLEEEFGIFPEYGKFYNTYKNKFDIVYRNLSGAPIMIFMDHNLNQLSSKNITNFTAEEIADELRNNGFKEDNFTPDHPAFKETEAYYQRLKEAMDP